MKLNASDKPAFLFVLAETSDHVHYPQHRPGLGRVLDVPIFEDRIVSSACPRQRATQLLDFQGPSPVSHLGQWPSHTDGRSFGGQRVPDPLWFQTRQHTDPGEAIAFVHTAQIQQQLCSVPTRHISDEAPGTRPPGPGGLVCTGRFPPGLDKSCR